MQQTRSHIFNPEDRINQLNLSKISLFGLTDTSTIADKF